jgi:hypothetical protein
VETGINERFFCVLLDMFAKFNIFVPPLGSDPVDLREQFSPIGEIKF